MTAFNGSIIKELRKARNLKQREVGAALGVSKGAICLYEKNVRGKRIAYQHLVSLSELFNVPIEVFYNPVETP